MLWLRIARQPYGVFVENVGICEQAPKSGFVLSFNRGQQDKANTHSPMQLLTEAIESRDRSAWELRKSVSDRNNLLITPVG